MYKKTIRNERGDLSFFTIFVILAIIMLMSFLLLFASVKINCMNIRKLYGKAVCLQHLQAGVRHGAQRRHHRSWHKAAGVPKQTDPADHQLRRDQPDAAGL